MMERKSIALGIGPGLLVSGLMLVACGEPAGARGVREPAVAGAFYPGEARTLEGEVKGYLSLAKKGAAEDPIAFVSPHAGYVYSGLGAAFNYRLLQGKRYARVIILAPSHQGYYRGASVPRETHYRTPLGLVPIDRAVVDDLAGRKTLFSHQESDRDEHSLEVQLPFLQVALGDFRLVPLVLGELAAEDYTAIARAILPHISKETLVVASSDFTHYGPRFRYEPYGGLGSAVRQRIGELDLGAVRFILNLDAQGFRGYVSRTGATICGARPIGVLIEVLKLRSAERRESPPVGRLLSYYTSGDLRGMPSDRANSVSYASVGFFASGKAPGPEVRAEDLLPAAPVSREDRAWLLRLGRRALARALDRFDPRNARAMAYRLHDRWPTLQLLQDSGTDPGSIPETAKSRAGAFVTLKKHGDLRGCIGYTTPETPLWEAVARNAVNAGLLDTRFSPVTKSELEEIEIEISVLTPPVKVPGPESFEVGRHGIIIEKQDRGAVFLPQVAVEQGWNREQTLSQLCLKAQLPPDAWKEGMTFRVFEAQVFAEEDRGRTEKR